jgi:prepilin peptidase CpaA
MAYRELVTFAPLIALLAWAAAIDVRARRIPNWLTFPTIATGLAQSLLASSRLGPGQSLAGIGAGFGLTFVMFVLRAMGGGDVKLFAGIGAWLGPVGVFHVFLVETILGMVIVVAQAIWARRLRSLLRGSALVVMNAAASGDLSAPAEEPTDAAAMRKRLPFAVPTLVALVWVVWAGGAAGR